ncbi:MAG: type VII secretion target, partial [Umezawaea sp.]
AEFEVVTAALETHARTVEEVGNDLEAALDEVRRVSLTADAYGAIGRQFVKAADRVVAAGQEALRAEVDDLESAARDLRDTATTYRRGQDEEAARFAGTS